MYPADVAQLISYLMAKNPQLRYQDYLDLAAETGNPGQTLADQNIPRPGFAGNTSQLPGISPAAASDRGRQGCRKHCSRLPARHKSKRTPQASDPAASVSDDTWHQHQRRCLSMRRASPWWQSSAIIWAASALGVLIVTMLIMFNLPEKEKQTADNGKSKKPATDKLRPGKPPKNGNKTLPTKETEPTQTVVDDPQGELLWASPTQGAPFKLTLVPPAGQLFMLIRPASLLDSEPGQLTLDALGPRFNTIRSQWEQEAGVKLADIETMVMTLHDNDEAFPRPSFVIQLKEAQQQDQLLVGWGNPQQSKTEGSNYFKGDKWCFFVPSDGDNALLSWGLRKMYEKSQPTQHRLHHCAANWPNYSKQLTILDTLPSCLPLIFSPAISFEMAGSCFLVTSQSPKTSRVAYRRRCQSRFIECALGTAFLPRSPLVRWIRQRQIHDGANFTRTNGRDPSTN